MSTRLTVRFLGLITAAVLGLGCVAATATADTYNVNASVPHEAPSQAAVIDSPIDGVVVNDVSQTLTGSCQVQNPAAVVSIWRGGSALGSVGCQSGRFSISVMLVVGQNNLIARTANVDELYGPDSLPLTITVNSPAPARPLPPGVNQPTTVDDRTAATNQGGLTGLSLAVDTPFKVLPSNKQATIRIVVSGGQQPYILKLQWGDGSTESHGIAQPGTYEFTHTYLVRRAYTVRVSLRDVLGSYAEYMYAIVSGSKSSTNAGSNSAMSPAEGSWRLVGIAWYCWVGVAVVAGILAFSYWLGYRRGRGRSKTTAQKRMYATKKKRAKAK